MFPTGFADRVVREHTQAGDLVLDPFAGRGTAIFSAATQGRAGVGIEISPVGFVYAKAKLAAAEHDEVAHRVQEIGRVATAARYVESARALPPFFHRCFAAPVRRFLLAARDRLDWRRSATDRTAMAILLVYLHGNEGAALSNQMRQTKSMSPDYAIRWWKEHNARPPQVDPVDFLTSRLAWRYAKGTPECESSTVYFGNSMTVLPRIAARMARGDLRRAKLLFTSPPYYGVTNYHYDQWLRLWLLGGPAHAARNGNWLRGKFEHRANYETLLSEVFARAKEGDRKSTRLNSSHTVISYAVFCLKKKNKTNAVVAIKIRMEGDRLERAGIPGLMVPRAHRSIRTDRRRRAASLCEQRAVYVNW